MNKEIIPIFYAVDDDFAKYAAVSIQSLTDNADKSRKYHIYVLNSGISEENKTALKKYENEVFSISFPDVTSWLDSVNDKLPVRDYYTKTTYYRLFIPDMYPEYEKAVYIDSDTVVVGDISELYDHDLRDNYVAAAHEQVMLQEKVYGDYVEKVLGIDRNTYFNAGVLVLNCHAFREKHLLVRFIELLSEYNFVVTQDEDYLNIICKDRVLWVNSAWNAEVFGTLPCEENEMKIIHYIMVSKPWHYVDCRLGNYFWEYTSKTSFADLIKKEFESYTDEQRKNDSDSCNRLMQSAINEINRPDNYLNQQRKAQAPDRIEVLRRIEALENSGVFDKDVEDDPPCEELSADQIEYVKKTLIDKAKTKTAFFAAGLFVKKLLRDKQMIIKDIVGIENFKELNSGAIITCNHFNAFDSFAMQMAYYASGQKSRKFYRVIREGNYMSFPGFYGFLMRNCDTLPLSSSKATMIKFVRGVNEILKSGHFILFYPEQSMWWNYRKPKPLKEGAYTMAAKNNVPVLPCFITMKDSDVMGKDGFYVQEYTIHIEKPIYPCADNKHKENCIYMMNKNYEVWKEIYEREYGIPLKYTTAKKEEAENTENAG